MRRRRSVPPAGASVNITSLCDIMLSLLIFFMLVSKKGVDVGADKKLEVPKTVMIKGIKIDDMGNTITLNVYPGPGEPQVTTMNPAVGARTSIPLREVAPGGGVREPLKELLTAFRGNNKEAKVIIRAGESLDYRFLEPVLLTCAAAKIGSINFAVEPAEK